MKKKLRLKDLNAEVLTRTEMDRLLHLVNDKGITYNSAFDLVTNNENIRCDECGGKIQDNSGGRVISYGTDPNKVFYGDEDGGCYYCDKCFEFHTKSE